MSNPKSIDLPIVKWAGGKSKLVRGPYLPHLPHPHQYRHYHEPFAGGLAMGFAMAPWLDPYKRIYVKDLNSDLINLYQLLAGKHDLPEESVRGIDHLILNLEALEFGREKHGPAAHYQQVRTLFNHPLRWKLTGTRIQNRLTLASRAAHFLYLNKTCFNGLFRVNRSGHFNVPMGDYKNPKICNSSELRRVHAAWAGRKMSISEHSYIETLNQAEKGDFVYLDPPYAPTSDTANFTGYTNYGFSHEDHEVLASVFHKLAARGCWVLLSNSDTPFVRRLYEGKGCEVVEIQAKRSINSDRKKRGEVGELLIVNRLTGGKS